MPSCERYLIAPGVEFFFRDSGNWWIPKRAASNYQKIDSNLFPGTPRDGIDNCSKHKRGNPCRVARCIFARSFCHFLRGNGNMCASIFFLWRKLPISFIAYPAQGKMHSVTKRTLFFFCSCAMKDIPPHLSLTTLALTNCGTRKIAEKKRRGISGENSCCEKRGQENCRSSTYFFCAKCGKLLCPSTNAHGKKRKFQVLTLPRGKNLNAQTYILLTQK